MDINQKDQDGRTALHCACADGADEVVKLMVAEGARMDITDNGDDVFVATIAKLMFCSTDGYKALHHAALNEHDSIVKYLLVQTAMQKLNEEAATVSRFMYACFSHILTR